MRKRNLFIQDILKFIINNLAELDTGYRTYVICMYQCVKRTSLTSFAIFRQRDSFNLEIKLWKYPYFCYEEIFIDVHPGGKV